MSKVAELIDAKDGPAAFASKIGVPPGRVRAWKCRNKIPRQAWPEILSAFPEITIERLRLVEAS